MRGVVVHSADGRPAPEALVFVGIGSQSYADLEEAVQPDPQGRFEVLGLPDDATWRLVVRAPGCGAWHALIDPGSHSRDVEVRLEQGAVVEGQVVTLEGQPVSDARVLAIRSVARATWPAAGSLVDLRETTSASTRTDATGTFRLSGLEAGKEVEIHVSKHGWARRGPPMPPITLPGGGPVTLTMGRVCVLEVSVRTAEGDEVGAMASVQVEAPDGWGTARGLEAVLADRVDAEQLSGERVRFSLAQTSVRGVDRASDAAPARVLASVPGLGSAETAVVLGAGEVVQATIVLPGSPGAMKWLPVEFQCKLPDGSPLTGGYVVAIDLGQGDQLSAAVRFGPDGAMERPIFLPVGSHAVRVGPGLDARNIGAHPVPEAISFHVLSGGDHVQRVPLAGRGNLIQLKVTSEDGRPVRGFDLRVHPAGRRPPRSDWVFVYDIASGQGGAPDPSVFVGVGNCEIELSLEGEGGQRIAVQAPGDGAPLSVSCTLVRGQEVPWRAIFRHHEAGNRR